MKEDWFEEGENIRLADEVVIDLLFTACGESYESLKNHIEEIDLDGILVKTLDLHGLLKTKNTLREKDISDSLILKKVLSEIKR